jgi:HNH endonuclease
MSGKINRYFALGSTSFNPILEQKGLMNVSVDSGDVSGLNLADIQAQIAEWDKKMKDLGSVRLKGAWPQWLRNYKRFEQQGRCAMCHKLYIDPEMDHKIELRNLGTNEYGNLQDICGGCHNTKTSRVTNECRKTARPVMWDDFGAQDLIANFHHQYLRQYGSVMERIQDAEQHWKIRQSITLMCQIEAFGAKRNHFSSQSKGIDCATLLRHFFSDREFHRSHRLTKRTDAPNTRMREKAARRLPSRQTQECRLLLLHCDFVESTYDANHRPKDETFIPSLRAAVRAIVPETLPAQPTTHLSEKGLKRKRKRDDSKPPKSTFSNKRPRMGSPDESAN